MPETTTSEAPGQGDNIVPKPQTVVVDAAAVVDSQGDSSGQLVVTLGGGIAVPDVGEFLVAPQSENAFRGVMGKVIGSTINPNGSTTLQLEPARIDEAYDVFDVDVSAALEDGDIEPGEPTGPAARAGQLGLSVGANHSLLTCTNSSSTRVELSSTVNDVKVRFQMNLAARSLRVGLSYSPQFRAAMTASGAVKCTLNDRYKPKAFIPLMATPPLGIELKPELTAAMNAALAVSATWGPTVEAGIDYRNGAITPYATASCCGQLKMDLGGNANAFAGIAGRISLAGRIGIGIDVGPKVDLTLKSDSCGSLTGSVEVRAKVEVNVFLANWGAELGSRSLNKTSLALFCPPTTVTATTTPVTKDPSPTTPEGPGEGHLGDFSGFGGIERISCINLGVPGDYQSQLRWEHLGVDVTYRVEYYAYPDSLSPFRTQWIELSSRFPAGSTVMVTVDHRQIGVRDTGSDAMVRVIPVDKLTDSEDSSWAPYRVHQLASQASVICNGSAA